MLADCFEGYGFVEIGTAMNADHPVRIPGLDTAGDLRPFPAALTAEAAETRIRDGVAADLTAAQAAMAATEVNARWQAEMADFFVGTDGRPPDESFRLLPEVFHLEDQLPAGPAGPDSPATASPARPNESQ